MESPTPSTPQIVDHPDPPPAYSPRLNSENPTHDDQLNKSLKSITKKMHSLRIGLVLLLDVLAVLLAVFPWSKFRPGIIKIIIWILLCVSALLVYRICVGFFEQGVSCAYDAMIPLVKKTKLLSLEAMGHIARSKALTGNNEALLAQNKTVVAQNQELLALVQSSAARVRNLEARGRAPRPAPIIGIPAPTSTTIPIEPGPSPIQLRSPVVVASRTVALAGVLRPVRAACDHAMTGPGPTVLVVIDVDT